MRAARQPPCGVNTPRLAGSGRRGGVPGSRPVRAGHALGHPVGGRHPTSGRIGRSSPPIRPRMFDLQVNVASAAAAGLTIPKDIWTRRAGSTGADATRRTLARSTNARALARSMLDVACAHGLSDQDHGSRPSFLFRSSNVGDMPVPNSTELHHTQANIHHAAAQKIRGLSSPECVGVRAPNHLLISRLKVRFLHGSPFGRGGGDAPRFVFPASVGSPPVGGLRLFKSAVRPGVSIPFDQPRCTIPVPGVRSHSGCRSPRMKSV
jgi:hypothetical protein